MLLIALFVATILRGVPQDDTATSQTSSTDGSSTIEVLTEEDVFVDLPGFRYEPVPAQALEQARAAYSSHPDAAESMLGVDGRIVVEGRREVGIVIVAFSTAEAAASEEFRAGFFDGFEDSVRDQGGGPLTDHEIEGVTARGGPTAQGYALSFIQDNAAITVLGGDRATAEMIASGLLSELADE